MHARCVVRGFVYRTISGGALSICGERAPMGGALGGSGFEFGGRLSGVWLGEQGGRDQLANHTPRNLQPAALCAAVIGADLCGHPARGVPVFSANCRNRFVHRGVFCRVVYWEISERDARFSGGQLALGIARDGVHHDVVGSLSALQREGVISFLTR